MSIEESIQNPDSAPPPEPVTGVEAALPVALRDEAPEVTPDTPPAVRPRRRALRTVGLIAVAAVIGLVGGTATGYGIQAEREPTPLPALNQPALAYPKPLPKGQEPEPLSAAEDRQVKANGDLRKLLVPRPKGARADGEDGWESLAVHASAYTGPSNMLADQLDLGIRRVATRSWMSGELRSVTIQLVQYRSGSRAGAAEHVENQQRVASREDRSGSSGKEVKGSGNGRYYVFPVEREPGYLDLYMTRAYIQHGDIAITILMSDTRKIAEKDIRSLAEQQLERM
ncbi:hypothetical protein [Streptomyces exfoliatus]|uniref:hypothetical protein n=1 Tax=Streptomyces exfoliatus TaxID=1905 RepID=UPI003C2D0362